MSEEPLLCSGLRDSNIYSSLVANEGSSQNNTDGEESGKKKRDDFHRCFLREVKKLARQMVRQIYSGFYIQNLSHDNWSTVSRRATDLFNTKVIPHCVAQVDGHGGQEKDDN